MSKYNSITASSQFLEQQAYAPMLYQNVGPLQTMSIYQQQIQKHNFDEFIANEMRRLRNQLAEEESKYVKDKLAENPVDLERRTRSPNSSGREENVTNPEDIEARSISSPERATLRKQRAVSCRKSRINNKLKKATQQYRNDFLADKVLQSKKTISEMRRKIRSVEQRLLAKGRTQAELAQLRTIYGVPTIDTGDDEEVRDADA
ncbi:PREDICTED: protein sisterless A, partial [Rhagoletis zephyria]|uniref:protein sisterless A n=1 Tax=Rhagoletis zephyria TaxID=28612 RepID=UPI0008114F5A